VVGACGFIVLVFMAQACLPGPGQHIGKNPAVPLIPAPGPQGRLRDLPDRRMASSRHYARALAALVFTHFEYGYIK